MLEKDWLEAATAKERKILKRLWERKVSAAEAWNEYAKGIRARFYQQQYRAKQKDSPTQPQD